MNTGKRRYPKRFATSIAKFLYKKAAEDVKVIDIRKMNTLWDFFVIATGNSRKHVNSLATSLVEEMYKKGHRPFSEEGVEVGSWALLDYGDVIVHIFTEEARKFYDLEGLWADCDYFIVSNGGEKRGK